MTIRPIFTSYHKALLRMNGTFTDLSGKTWTARGTAQIQNGVARFGGSSGLFDGNSDWIDTPDSADWAVGSGNMHLALWIRSKSNAGTQGLWGQIVDASNRLAFWQVATSGRGRFYSQTGGTVWLDFNMTHDVTINNWHLITIDKIGTTFYITLDGDFDNSVVDADVLPDIASIMRCGSYDGAANFFNGNMGPVEFMKGKGYTPVMNKRIYAWLTGRLM